MMVVWVAIGIAALVAYGVAVRTVQDRYASRRTTKTFDESLVSAAFVCFGGGFGVAMIAMVLVGNVAPLAPSVAMLAGFGAAVLLTIHAAVLRCRRAFAVARARREETGLDYKALLPGWAVGLSWGVALSAVELGLAALIGRVTDPLLNESVQAIYTSAGDTALQSFTLRYTQLMMNIAIAIMLSSVVFGFVMGLRQRYRIERRDQEYLRVHDRLSHDAAAEQTAGQRESYGPPLAAIPADSAARQVMMMNRPAPLRPMTLLRPEDAPSLSLEDLMRGAQGRPREDEH